MPITGALVVGAALYAFSTLEVDTSYYVIALIMYAFGMGLGFTMQVVVTAVQNSVDRRNMGVATASVTFFRSMGGAIGTALLGAILNIRLKHHLEAIIGAAQGQRSAGPINTNDITAIRALPEPIKGWVLEAFTRSMDDVFLVAVPFMAVAFVIALTMQEKPLKGRGQHSDSATPRESADSDLASMAH
jgi:MFS family permease